MRKPGRLSALADVNVVMPLLATLLGGVLAIVGGCYASNEAIESEREFRRQEDDAAFRGAVRVVDLELFARAQMLLNAYGVEHPGGTVGRPEVREAWADATAGLERSLASGDVAAPLVPAATEVTDIQWALEDRRVIAARVRGGQWFTVTTAAGRWSDVARRVDTVADLRARSSHEVVPTLRALIAAREALSDAISEL